VSWRSVEVAEDDGEIRRRLLTPMRQVDLAELAAIWTVHTIRFRLAGLGRLAGMPALPGRLRGAFGKALMAGASDEALAGKPCSFDPPSAFEVLFRKQGRLTPGLDLASPWIILLDTQRGDLVVSLRLYGFAVEWAPAAAEAMTRAVRELVDWRDMAGGRGPVARSIERRADTRVGCEAPAGRDGLDIELVSPLVVTGHDARDKPEGLLPGLGARISALARWHDVALEERVDWSAIKQAARRLEYVFTETAFVTWRRTSERQRRVIPMGGVTGRLTISGVIGAEIALLLAIGETCCMGADTTLGCGRFRVSG
jgi:hypothetical protein